MSSRTKNIERWAGFTAPKPAAPPVPGKPVEMALSPEIVESRRRKQQIGDDAAMAQAYVNKKKHAKTANHAFDLLLSDWIALHEKKTCAYSGIAFSYQGENSRTMERINPKIGYTPENTVCVTSSANSEKSLLDAFIKGDVIPDTMKIKLLRKALYQLEKATK